MHSLGFCFRLWFFFFFGSLFCIGLVVLCLLPYMDPIFCVYKTALFYLRKKKRFVTNMWEIFATFELLYFILVWFVKLFRMCETIIILFFLTLFYFFLFLLESL